MADIINVKSPPYNAAGDGSTDDYPAVQAAFDAAFGSAASPHGYSNRHLNKPVFFPNGNYVFSSGTPTLTRVVGGRVYGSAAGGTQLSKGSGSIIKTNGCTNLVFEHFAMLGGHTNNRPLFDLDWNGDTTNGGGLHSNILRNVLFSNFIQGVVIADSGNGGANNYFEMCSFSAGGGVNATGLEAKGTQAINNTSVMGGATNCLRGYWCSGGSIHIYEMSAADNGTDVRVDSGYPVCIIGGRSESGDAGEQMFSISAGQLTIRGVLLFSATTAGKIGTITGGKVTMDSCRDDQHVFAGTGGQLYLRGNYFANAGYKSGYIATGGSVPQDI